MANKWRDTPIYELATPFIRHFHVFDVPVLRLNLPITPRRVLERKTVDEGDDMPSINIICIFDPGPFTVRKTSFDDIKEFVEKAYFRFLEKLCERRYCNFSPV